MSRRIDVDQARATGLVVALDDDAATDRAVVGGKSAALARARQLGLPVLPGFVLTVAGVGDPQRLEALRPLWEELSGNGTRTLAVRSSAVAEDGDTSSMAGHFTSVLDVDGWDAFTSAVAEVLASARAEPMAVLVQPMQPARVGGVLFGTDPISGRSDRILVEVVHGGPDALVSGGVVARSHVLTLRGRLVDTTLGEGPLLSRRERHALATLAARTDAAFGGPQDVEWAIDEEDHLWLFQSRPVTASAIRVPSAGPIFGPGPIAETLPEPVSTLEDDLWATPIRTGIEGALVTVGAANRRLLRASPLLINVGGRLAADLGLLGIDAGPKRRFAWLDPRAPAQRLAAAWRVGRLRRAIPGLAADIIESVDAELRLVPTLGDLEDELLLRLLERSRDTLHAVHGHEVLAGILGVEGGVSGAAAALAAVARGRIAGKSDAEIVADDPTALALYAPQVGRAPSLPEVPPSMAAMARGAMGPREALRLRARWLEEVSARAAAELGRRLVQREVLADERMVRHLRLHELAQVVAGEALPRDLDERAAVAPGAPLPPAFRLAPDGSVHAVTSAGGGARGAGGGRGVGPVHHASEDWPPAGAVLVTRTLDPALAGALPGLAGLVAETGSALSHLAIVARELGVPTVVGFPDALTRFPAGTVVVVDGQTGDVQAAEGRS